MQVIHALTAAPRATRWLERSSRGRVHSKFPSVLNLTNEVGDLLSLVVPVVGNGPFSAVLNLERIPEEIEATSQVGLEDRAVTVGEFRFELSSTQVWRPVPA